MIITHEEIKSFLINYVNYADNQELIDLYQKIKNVTITDEGDKYFPCLVVQEKKP